MHSSQLVDCPAIGPHSVQRGDEGRTLVVDHTTVIPFTPTEYQLLLPLLSGQLMKDDELVKQALGYSVEQWNKGNLTKYIDKLRSKLRPAGLDVHRVGKYGYVLLAS